MDYVLEQVHDPNGHNTIISGSGGTGKTTVICELICQLLSEGYAVAVTAMTGKATSVLRNKVWKAIEEKELEFDKDKLCIETVTKITKKSSVLGTTSDGSTKFTNTWRDPRAFPYDVLFVDELSMVPQFISQWWMMTNARVIGCGDECQLPEVNTSEVANDLNSFRHDLHVSKMNYTSGYGVKILKTLAHLQLHKVLRSDNDIALLCGDLRDFTQSKQQLLSRIKYWAEKSPDISYGTSKAEIETDPEWQIICYTNKLCAEINEHLCIGGDRYPDLHDKILLYDNINPLGIYNGDVMYFADLLNAIEHAKNRKRPIYVCVKWQNRMPKSSGNIWEQRFAAQYIAYNNALREASEERWKMARTIIENASLSEEQKDQYIVDLDKIGMSKTNKEDALVDFVEKMTRIDRDTANLLVDHLPPTPQLYFVNIGYGYAITTHKSQGSEYDNVCYVLERFDKPLVYTGLSRAKKRLKVVNITSTK